MRLFRLFGPHRQIHHAEIELGGLAQNLLQTGRILQPGDLHQYAVGAFALNCRLNQTHGVDASLDDLDRLIDRLAHPLRDRRIGGSQRDGSVVVGDIERALAGGAGIAGERLRQFPQLAER